MNKTEKLQKLTALHKDIISTTQRLKEAETTLVKLRADYQKLKAMPETTKHSVPVAYHKTGKYWLNLEWEQSDVGQLIRWRLEHNGAEIGKDDAVRHVSDYFKQHDALSSCNMENHVDGVIVGCCVVYLDRIRRFQEQYPKVFARLADKDDPAAGLHPTFAQLMQAQNELLKKDGLTKDFGAVKLDKKPESISQAIYDFMQSKGYAVKTCDITNEKAVYIPDQIIVIFKFVHFSEKSAAKCPYYKVTFKYND